MSSRKVLKNKKSRNIMNENNKGNNDVSLRFKEVREIFKLTQKKFADKLSITNSYISEIESGKNISSNVTRRLAEAFKVSPNWLLLGEGPMFIKGNQNNGAGYGDEVKELDEDLKKLIWYCQNSPLVKHTILSFFIRMLRNDKTIIEDDINNNKPSSEKQ